MEDERMTDDIRHTLCLKSGKILVYNNMVFQSFAHPNSPDNPTYGWVPRKDEAPTKLMLNNGG